MLPAQEAMAVRARIRLRGENSLVYRTKSLHGLSIPNRRGEEVRVMHDRDLPAPFWSRSSRKVSAAILLDIEPSRIVEANLHCVLWDGDGSTTDPIRFNGEPLALAGQGKHDVIYRVVAIDPSKLRRGDNTFSVLSTTEHHGIEILHPGPALVVRYRTR